MTAKNFKFFLHKNILSYLWNFWMLYLKEQRRRVINYLKKVSCLGHLNKTDHFLRL